MADKDFSADYLRSILAYDADTGVFTRLVRTCNSVKVGDVAGCKCSDGYIIINVLGRPAKAHRLAWLHVHGAWPAGQIDHIDSDRSNNAIANLRDVSGSVNQQNQRRARSSSTHGILGVARSGARWRAQIWAGGIKRYIGTYDTPAEANAAYIETKRRLHEGCTI